MKKLWLLAFLSCSCQVVNSLEEFLEGPSSSESTVVFSKDKGFEGFEKKIVFINGLEFKFVKVKSDFRIIHNEAKKITYFGDFWILETKVTQEMFETVLGYNPSSQISPYFPVHNLTKEDISSFVRIFNKNLKASQLPYEASLPSSQQWNVLSSQYETASDFYCGTAVKNVEEYEWLPQEAHGELQNVGRKKVNPLGVYDIWCNGLEYVDDLDQMAYRGLSVDGFPSEISFRLVLKERTTASVQLDVSETDITINVDDASLRVIQVPRRGGGVDSFWMSETVVTQDIYEKVMNENLAGLQGEKYPAYNMHYGDVLLFIKRLNKMLEASHIEYQVMLPTGLQWVSVANCVPEHDFRPVPSKYLIGENEEWFAHNSGGSIHEVATKEANDFGFYDIIGNVREFVQSQPQSSYVSIVGYRFDAIFQQDREYLLSKKNVSRYSSDETGFRIVVVHK